MKLLYNRHKQFIPLLLMIWISGVTAIAAIQGNVELTLKNYLGFLAVLITVGSYFLFRNHFRYIFLTLLFLGLLNLYEYSIVEGIISSGYGSWHIGVQLASLLVVILVYFVNFKRANNFILFQLGQLMPSNDLTQDVNRSKLNRIYENMSESELESIIDDNRYTADAKDIAKNILSSRQKS